MSSDPVASMWQRLSAALGTTAPRPGQRLSFTVGGGQTLVGVIDSVDQQGAGNSLFVRMEAPNAGTMFVGAFDCGGAMASLQVYVYGADAARLAESLRTPLSQWLTGLFAPHAAS